MRYWQNWDSGSAAAEIDQYWQSSEGEKHWRWLVSSLIMEAITGFPVLEVGCGSGLIAQELTKTLNLDPANYVGGDISEEMLKIARERLPDVDFRTLDILNLELEDDAFPTVINIHVIQHLPSFERALDELVRVTRKRLFIACWFAEKERVKFSNASDAWSGQRFYNNRYTKISWDERLRSHDKVKSVQWQDLGGANAAVLVDMK